MLLLGGLTLLVIFDLKKSEETVSRITSLNLNDIQQIQIKQKNKPVITFELKNQHWFITSPIQAVASPTKIERLLKISQIPNPVSYPLSSDQKADYGLENPNIELSFNQTTLALGTIEPVNSRRYIGVTDTLSLLADTFIHLINTPVNNFIDTRLITDNAQITRLSTAQFELVIDDNNRWRDVLNTSEENTSLPSDDVQTLLDEWRFARAISVSLTTDLETPKEDIFIHLENDEVIHFVIQKNKSGAVLQLFGTSLYYHFSLTKLEQLLNLPTS